MEKALFSIAKNAYFRRGAYFGIMAQGEDFGYARLFLISRRGAVHSEYERGKLLEFFPTHEGEKVPFAVKATATEVVIETRYGSLRICFPEHGLLLVQGDPGLGLTFQRKFKAHEMMKPRGSKSFEAIFMYICTMVFTPVRGQGVLDAPWSLEDFSTPIAKLALMPKPGEGLCLAIEEFTHSGTVRRRYPAYADGLAAVEAEWQAFLATIPHFKPPYEARREEAAFMLWMHLVSPMGMIKRPFIFMFPAANASSWQMCENAMALGSIDPALSIELLLNMFDHQSPAGQLPDAYNDSRGAMYLIKPPQQGWALKYLLARQPDLGAKVPAAKLKALYSGMVRWADWFFKWRDDDHDGIPQYEHPDECGMDDCSVFKKSFCMETPDLCAYIVLIYEALGDLARVLGMAEAVRADWYAKAKALTDRMVETFWNGERFTAMVSGTHELVLTDSLLYYIPIILGHRLPQAILDKLTADLSREGAFLTPYGVASESLHSDNLALGGRLSLGTVIPPCSMLICLGLEEAGEQRLAKEYATRYCQAMVAGGLSFLIDPNHGAAGTAGSWGSCAFITLAQMCD